MKERWQYFLLQAEAADHQGPSWLGLTRHFHPALELVNTGVKIAGVCTPVPPLTSCMTEISHLAHLFPHLQNRDNNST